MQKIIHYFIVHTPAREVYRALTTQKGLAGWWTTDVTADTKVGGTIDFRFADQFHPIMKIVALEPGEKVVWQCVANEDAWLDNTFTFELDEKDGDTQVMFAQDYAKKISDEMYGTFNFNWGYYLHSLKKLCEDGKGFPFGV